MKNDQGQGQISKNVKVNLIFYRNIVVFGIKLNIMSQGKHLSHLEEDI